MEKHFNTAGKEIKRQYLNDEERNIFVVLTMITNELNGEMLKENGRVETLQSIADKWEERGFITKEERKNLKSATSFLNKFLNHVYGRLDHKTQQTLMKKFMTGEVKINDVQFQNLVKRYFNEREKHAVIEKDVVTAVVEDMAAVYCVGCTCNYKDCPIYRLYDECGYQKLGERDNCPFAATINDIEDKEEAEKVSRLKKLVAEKNKVRKLSEKESKELLKEVAKRNERTESSGKNDNVRKGNSSHGARKSKIVKTGGGKNKNSRNFEGRTSEKTSGGKDRKNTRSNNPGYSKGRR